MGGHAKPPSGASEAALAYLSLYTHRVAISNHRLVSADACTVAFRWKDYRIKRGDRMKVTRLDTNEFTLRSIVHVLPDGFHRIRYYGLLAGTRQEGEYREDLNTARDGTGRGERRRWRRSRSADIARAMSRMRWRDAHH